jgi:hypothetical protein
MHITSKPVIASVYLSEDQTNMSTLLASHLRLCRVRELVKIGTHSLDILNNIWPVKEQHAHCSHVQNRLWTSRQTQAAKRSDILEN